MKERFKQYYMRIANTVAEFSYAKRLKVGAVLVNKHNRIIGTGYNGTPAGSCNCCEEIVDGVERTKENVIHAEQNLILSIAKSNESTNETTLFVTHSPCIYCAKLIQGSGIGSVFYQHQYRDDSGIKYLRKYNILVEQIILDENINTKYDHV